MDSEMRSRPRDTEREASRSVHGKEASYRKRRDRSLSSEDERDAPRRRRRHSRSEDEDSDVDFSRSRRREDAGNREKKRREDSRRERRDRSKDYSSDDYRTARQRHKYRARSRSPSSSRRNDSRTHQRKRSRSPTAKRRRKSRSASPQPVKRSRAPLPSQEASYKGVDLPPGEKAVEKQKPNFKPTGLLAKEANTVAGTTTVLKYHEPPEARKPPAKEQWRMYVFKKQDLLDTIQLHSRSVWLVGRDQKITDLFLEHPSISKQHAVIQFRHRTSTNEFGDKLSKVKPYLIDLDSANGTKLNGKKVEASRYMELLDQDVVSFGDSEREYVMMLPTAEK
ncbi:Smad nuclear interacting protein [Sphaerulina musiva]